MKPGLLFSLTTGGFSILFFLISAQFMKEISPGTTTYLLWFFMIWTVVDMMIFPFAILLIRPLTIAPVWKIPIYLALGLVALNIPLGAQENQWITIDAVRNLLHPGSDPSPNHPYSIGMFHLLPLLAFSLSLFFFRKHLFNPLPG